MRGRQGRRHTLTETFESEHVDYGSSRFMMDRTLYKGIKQNNVSKIIDTSSQAGQIGEKELPSEEQELESIVREMRKKFDEIRTNTNHLDAEVEKNRKALDLLKAEEQRLSDHNSAIRFNYERVQEEFEGVAISLEARVYDLDICKQMMSRLKKDILVMKKRNFDKDVALKKGSIKARTLRQEDFNKTKLSFKCRDMLHSIERTVVSKQHERTGKINSFYDALNKRHQNTIKKDERERDIEEVMMRAMSEKLQEEKEWINISLVNTFFKRFLKNKMETLIRLNSETEGAYHKIRSSTDIKDCKDLISRFLNHERDYGTVLERISQKQNKLEDLKMEKQTLERVQVELKLESDKIHESTHRHISSTNPLEKELSKLEENIFDIHEKKELWKKWAIKLFCSFGGKTREKVKTEFSDKPFKELINTALLELNKYSSSIIGDENNADQINQMFTTNKVNAKIFDDDMVVRNRRVKTMVADDSLAEADDREAYYDGTSEADYLQYNRRVTKKNDQTRRFRIKTQAK